MAFPESFTGEKFSTRMLSEAYAARVSIARKKTASRKTGAGTCLSLPALDIFAIVAVYSLSELLRIGYFIPFGPQNFATLSIMVFFQLLALYPIGGYSRRTHYRSARYFSEHMIASAATLVGTVFCVFFLGTDYLKASRLSVLVTLSVTPFLAMSFRRLLAPKLEHDKGIRTYLVIGGESAFASLTSWLKASRTECRLFYTGTQNGLVHGSNGQSLNLTGATIEQAIAKLDDVLDGIVIACNPAELSVRFQNRLVAINFGVIPVYTLDSFYAREWQAVPLATLSAPWALTEGFNLSQSLTYVRLKRVEDVVLSALALILLSPVFALIAILIKLDSPGPVIFRQRRVGLQEKRFTLFKFRTMRVGSETGPVYTGDHDCRITRVGRILRLTRFDEIPQFINVLRGEMSLIGPRAEWERLVTDYERLIPYYHLRHLVKPGITGWAQVNYSYGANLEDTRSKLRYDLYYVKYFSFMLDISILVKTAYIMLFGKGR
jgi:exopolysaccharide biosynthesis polyprenyl glycosylphosphotransferase